MYTYFDDNLQCRRWEDRQESLGRLPSESRSFWVHVRHCLHEQNQAVSSEDTVCFPLSVCVNSYFSFALRFLAQGEIEAIVVPVCLAFLLTTLLGVLFCFNKRDL